MSKPSLMVGVVLLAVVISSGCRTSQTLALEESKGTAAAGGGEVGLANPASVHCTELGYALDIRSDEEGNQYGVCVFPNGSECDEWAFFRGECGPAEEAAAEGSAPSPVEEYEVIGWLGSVTRLPAGSQYDDYVAFQPDGAGEVGLTGASADMETEIIALRDKDEPGKYAHFWGTLTCGVPDYGGCQLVVTQLRYGTMQPIESGPVDGWQGTIVSNPPDAQFDDYFVLAGAFPVAFGIEGYGDDEVSADIHARLEQLRDSGVSVRVWGNLVAGLPDAFASQLMVTRMEVDGALPEPSGPVEEQVEGWVGTVASNPEGAEFDDYFQMLDQNGTRYGIDSRDGNVGQQIIALRDTGRLVRVWGVLRQDVPDAYGAQIDVARVEDYD